MLGEKPGESGGEGEKTRLGDSLWATEGKGRSETEA